jgi:hypothetical protein
VVQDGSGQLTGEVVKRLLHFRIVIGNIVHICTVYRTGSCVSVNVKAELCLSLNN